MEREALADRQAQQSAAYTQEWEKYEPITTAARVAAFDEWLNADPSDSEEARTERYIRELTGAA